MNRIEGGVGLADRPRFAEQLWETKFDPSMTAGQQWDALMHESVTRYGEKAHGNKALNNFYRHFNYEDPHSEVNWRYRGDKIFSGYTQEIWDHTFKENGESLKHSPAFLAITPQEFYKRVDEAAENAGLEPQKIAESLARTRDTDEIYNDDIELGLKVREAFKELIDQGFTVFDLAS